MTDELKNKFSLSEWSGALGDLGTMLPLAFILIVYNGYTASPLFFLWGVIFVITGWFYKVPVAVQPLKVMSVVAVANGYPVEMLAFSGLLFGVIFIILSVSGLIGWLQRFFSPSLVRGIQLGIGLILMQKAVQLVMQKGMLLHTSATLLPEAVALFLIIGGLLFFLQYLKKTPFNLLLIFGSILIVKFSIFQNQNIAANGSLINWTPINLAFLRDSFIYLIIPQLPLTLGNAIYAEHDVCHSVWKQQARRVTTTHLSLSIGLSNVLIGLCGGFPICHGAGGSAAHAQFGAKTGGATIIMGGLLIAAALLPNATFLFFCIPVPILAAMLVFDSWRLVMMIKRLNFKIEYGVAILVGLMSFFTRNLTIALLAGLLLEKGWQFYRQQVIAVD